MQALDRGGEHLETNYTGSWWDVVLEAGYKRFAAPAGDADLGYLVDVDVLVHAEHAAHLKRLLRNAHRLPHAFQAPAGTLLPVDKSALPIS